MLLNPSFKPLKDETLGPKLGKICSDQAPERLRQAFAKGMAPGFTPEELLMGLYQLAVLYDELFDAVQKTIKNLPENVLSPLASRTDMPGPVLFLLSEMDLAETVIEAVISNKNTPNEAIAHLARRVKQRLAVFIADNQKRLLEYPVIIENLYLNKFTPMSVANRIIELAARHRLELGLDAYSEMLKALDMDPPQEEDPIDAELAAAELDQRFATIEVSALKFISHEDEDPEEIAKTETAEETHNRIILSQLPVSAKIRLAMLGNRFHRSQLIRDANKVVALAAIKSPSITETEIDEYSKNRQLSEDVIRYITRRKDWLKSYRIKLNLVNNPKTPITVALTLLNFLRKNDLASLARSRNVPQVIRMAANQRARQKT
ncbi:hypothetical protein KKF84_21070 [Myxococcota bacterium]|nr:hypothetical protein [Myxococcota bacterium]MBU1537818.1 hypothetical protein [Myxococcota bacterium]